MKELGLKKMGISIQRTVSLAAIIATAFLLNGCAALLIGGAAAGGYVVGKDERPVGQQVDDGTITASVKTRLVADKYAPGWKIDVDTRNSIVTLNGEVTSYVARSQAEKIARDTKGVTEVVNNLKVVDPE